jgi:adenosyl cobinamide kinase/adenosyl cobinamide phosphate guanylyltransferase
MIMITGGAFQGKTQYAKTRFGLSDSDMTDGAVCDITKLTNLRCIWHYELLVKRLIAENIDPIAFTQKLDCEIIIITEIGCGIIPIDKSEREWREMTGRAGCIIAERADQVVRLCCGIDSMIKGVLS